MSALRRYTLLYLPVHSLSSSAGFPNLPCYVGESQLSGCCRARKEQNHWYLKSYLRSDLSSALVLRSGRLLMLFAIEENARQVKAPFITSD